VTITGLVCSTDFTVPSTGPVYPDLASSCSNAPSPLLASTDPASSPPPVKSSKIPNTIPRIFRAFIFPLF
jgi:hypothetical protein